MRSQKRALWERVDALTTSMEEYKEAMETVGLALVDEEVDMVE